MGQSGFQAFAEWLVDTILFGGGLTVGGWVCLGFPQLWGKCRYRFFGWVGGLLSLVDRQKTHKQRPNKQFMKKQVFYQVDHSRQVLKMCTVGG